MQNALPEAAVERFKTDLKALVPAPDARLGVAVSGGPDSLALLLLCHAAFPERTLAATVDHGLRPKAADEARTVAEVCADLGIEHSILTPGAPITGSLQAAAREARYGLLERWADENGIAAILTAHHADDQAETLLMRLMRGAGLSGLAGVRAVNGRIVRPLLRWRREDLLAVVTASGLEPIADPSNEDDRFDRVRIRKAIADADWLDPQAMAQSAAALAKSDAALRWMEDRLFAERVAAIPDGLRFDNPENLPSELRRRILIRSIGALDPGCKPDGPDVSRLMESLKAGRKSSIGNLLICPTSSFWELAPAPPRRKI